MTATKPFSIKVIGAFDLFDRTRKSVRPSGRKDSAILAILALTKNHRQSRTWLQDRLWGDRGPAQGAASLRQALTTLRAILNADGEIIKADRTWVWLEQDKLEFDHISGDVAGEVLRGFDLRDEGFNDWLRETRGSFEAKKASWGIVEAPEQPDRCWYLDVAPIRFDDTDLYEIRDYMADSLAEAIAVIGVQANINKCSTMVPPTPRATDIIVTTRVVSIGGGCVLSLRATDGFGSLRWHVRREFANLNWSDLRAVQAELAQLFQDFVISTEAKSLKGARWSAHSNGCQALLGILVPGTITTREIAQCSEAANAADEKGIYHALLGYSKLLEYGERELFQDLDHDVVMQNFRSALRLSPNNGMVNALAGHSYGFLVRNLERNLELTEEAVRISPGSGLCWIYRAVSLGYCGRATEAVVAATTAVRLCRGTVAFSLAKAAELYTKLVAGDVKGAIHAGETSIENIVYRPAIMDLMTAYSLDGQLARGRKKLRILKQRDPDLSLDRLKSSDYPIVNNLHRELTVNAAGQAGLI